MISKHLNSARVKRRDRRIYMAREKGIETLSKFASDIGTFLLGSDYAKQDFVPKL